MSEVRSLTPLSENDYETIAEAVMETARGRWFMTEFARRNRQADTAQLLTAIGRIERAVGAATTEAQPEPDPIWREAAALIGDLRIDLERISGRAESASSGLAQRIETSSSQILGATEAIQEGAWRLREAGGNDGFCDLLDRRTTEIFASAAIIEGTAQQIGKIADTIAMLDSSLRAFADRTVVDIDAEDLRQVSWTDHAFDPPASMAPPDYEEIAIVEIGEPGAARTEILDNLAIAPMSEYRASALQSVSDDLFFEENAGAVAIETDLDFIEPVAATPPPLLPEPEARPAARLAVSARPGSEAIATSEADLYALDALPADRKLAYFA